MKILVLSNTAWDFYQRANALSGALAALGHEIVYVEPFRYAGHLPQHLDPPTQVPVQEGVRVLRRQSGLPRGVRMALAQGWDNMCLIRRERPDVVLLYDVVYALLPALLLRFSSCKAVLDYTDDWPEWSRVPWERALLRRVIIPAVARLSDLCLATAALLAEDLRPWARRVVLLPNGAAAFPELLDEASLRGGEGVLFVGQIGERIDVAFLIELAHRLPDVPVRVLGAGRRWPELAEAAKTLPNLDAPGAVSHDEALAAIRQAAVCLVAYLPSRLADRCSPVKLAEYWAHGKAVVATRTAEIERMGEGRLCLVRDAAEAANVVQSLLVDPDARARLGRAGHQAACEQYNYDVLCRQFIEALDTKGAHL